MGHAFRDFGTEAEKKEGDKMKNIWRYAKRYWPLYVVAILSMVVSILLDAAAPQITRRIIDDVIVGGQLGLLMRLLMGLLGIGLGRAVFQYVKEFIFDYAASGIGSRLRKDLFDHIQTLSVGYFDSHNTGELMARVKDDVDRIWNACGFVGMLILECFIHTVIMVACMFTISPVLTMAPLFVMALIVVCAVRMEKGLGLVYGQISEETARMNTVAQENLAGVRTVKAFAREPYEKQKFEGHNKQFYELNMEQARLIARYQPNISFLSKVLLMTVIVAGGILVIRGRMTIGQLGAFSEYASNIIWPMEMVGWLSNDLAAALASEKKIRAIFAKEPEIRVMGADPETGTGEDVGERGTAARDGAMCRKGLRGRAMTRDGEQQDSLQTVDREQQDSLRTVDGEQQDSLRTRDEAAAADGAMRPQDGFKIRGHIRFDQVDLELHGQKVLKGISFDLPAGKTLGIMGMTGSGKTSIVNLIQRFYDVSAGTIKIDGRKICQIPLPALRSQIAVVMQDVFLFSDSIAENIKMGKKGSVSQASVEKAAVRAGAHGFIMALDQRYDTVIGERGTGLSGGQKQRISIARAIAKESPILILDDSTSALDMETEKEIERQLAGLKRSTKIIIGHRISSVRHADEILILENGRIVERGTHEELMAKKGRYHQTYVVQYGEEETWE